MKIKTFTTFLTLMVFASPLLLSQKQGPLMSWRFEESHNRTTLENISNMPDTIEGNFKLTTGVIGMGLRLDGFTTCLRRTNGQSQVPANELSVESWIALDNYPWNWCPILTTESNETKGYRLMVGPHGQVSMEAAIAEKWISCVTERLSLPLRKWIHIVGIYKANEDMKVYINGELKAMIPIQGRLSFPGTNNQSLLAGMVASPEKPSDIHRTWGTLPQYYGLSGIIDEIKVYGEALSPDQVKRSFNAVKTTDPDIQEHKFPTLDSHPGRFGAFYTKLKYYDGWDNLWPVDQDPDIVVCFDKLPVKVMFWRGIRYGTSWVSENENWMSDQSVEAWGVGDEDNEGCFEHMQDRHCRFSHVRIIENNDARVVIHWRYAPVSAYNNTWRVDPKTGWECWIDEYHYIYPDASGIRKVSWLKGSLQYPRQFQESLPLLQPGQVKSDVVNLDYVHVADYNGNINAVSFVENPRERDTKFANDYTIQQYNFKSENKPFICFEPGNNMSIRWNNIKNYNEHSGCNHFPVGQARCDGRTSTTSDRPSHFDSFPISDPVIHEKEGRNYWNGLYGINGMNMDELIKLGRSWAYAPEMIVGSKEFVSGNYDLSERCYKLENKSAQAEKLEIILKGSDTSPVINPAFFIKNWNAGDAKVMVDNKPLKDVRIGINHELEGDDLVVFLFLEKKKDVKITIMP